MNIKIISSSKPNNITPSSEFETLSGHCAGICYMADNFTSLQNEDPTKTQKRVVQTMTGGHHSVFDHNYITLYLEGIPKILAMFLNNEKMYTTSEKSARYTVMDNVSPLEQKLYDKWLKNFEQIIEEKYPEMNSKKRHKLAMENARYMLSIFTPTCMAYTVSYRQLNYIFQWLDDLKNFIHILEREKRRKTEKNEEKRSLFLDKISLLFTDNSEWHKTIDELKQALLDTGYINSALKDFKNRTFSLIQSYDKIIGTEEIFSDIYSVCYLGTFAQLAQAQRHRTINYSFAFPENEEYYIPPILVNGYKMEWLRDCNRLKQAGIVPQCTQILIREQGTYEDFILKCKERVCSAAQLEIAQQTQNILEEYIKASSQKQNSWIWEDIQKYMTYKARCTYPDFTCPTPCGWAEGINLQREI